jgi:hypothetical protein
MCVEAAMGPHTLTVKLEKDGRQKVTIQVPQGRQREGLDLA